MRPLVAVLLPCLLAVPALAQDVDPPEAIADLRVSAPAKASELHLVLTWTAPRDLDNGPTGNPAAAYDIRYATSPIVDDADFSSARHVDGTMTAAGLLPSPAVPGSTEVIEIIGLRPGITYHVAIKSSDIAGNASALSNPAQRATVSYQGYGQIVAGGGEGVVCRVDSLANSGAGTLRDCIFPAGGRNCSSEPRTIVFDVGGTITLTSDILLDANDCQLTIDGSTAPLPGITIRKPPCATGLSTCPAGDACLRNGEFKIGANQATPAEDIILTHLRFRGNYELGWGACTENSGATLGLQYHFRKLVLDHLTIRNGVDAAPDMWTGSSHSSDVTLAYVLMAWSNHPLTISDGGSGSRSRLSIHHNVLARSGERMPNFNLWNEDVDFRNNVIFDWNANSAGSYGSRVRNPDGQGGSRKTDANIVNNVWLPHDSRQANRALVYGDGPGSSSSASSGDGGPAGCTTGDGCAGCPAQGTVVSNSYMGELWVAGNVLPPENCDHWSSVTGERAVPVHARVNTDAAADLASTVLPSVGTHYREPDEQTMLDEVLADMGGVSDPAPDDVGNLRRTDQH